MHELAERLTVDSGEQGEQAGGNDRAQTSSLRRWVPGTDYASGAFPSRFRKCPSYRFPPELPALG
jgi:hypothetical protein